MDHRDEADAGHGGDAIMPAAGGDWAGLEPLRAAIESLTGAETPRAIRAAATVRAALTSNRLGDDDVRQLAGVLEAIAALSDATLSADELDRVLQFAVLVVRASEYSVEAAMTDPQTARLLVDAALRRTGATAHRSSDDYREALAREIEGTEDEAAAHAKFCSWRRREHVRVALRDLAGLSELETLMVELSRLAAVSVEHAQDVCWARLVAKHGRPIAEPEEADEPSPGFAPTGENFVLRDVDDPAIPTVASDNDPVAPSAPLKVARFATAALGKAGGFELNYSSDIDLIFVYEEEGETEGIERPAEPRPVRVVSNHEFFNKLCREIMAFLTTPGPGGAPYRVDLRLRPEGNSGPLSRSLDSYRHYFATQAEGWERIAYAKARVVAGDNEFAEVVGATFRSFVYSEFFNTELLPEIAHLKARIDAEVAHGERSWRDIKRGFGGIRELEFVVGSLQLLYGREHPRLRQRRGTIWTIDALLDSGLLDVQTGGWMREVYLLLRHVEQRIQIYRNRQTHELPPDGDPLEWRLFGSLPAFVEAGGDRGGARVVLEHVRRRIHDEFEHLFANENVPSAPTSPLLRDLASDNPAAIDKEAVVEQLAQWRLGSPRALAALVGLRDGTAEVYRSRRGRQFFETIAPHLLRVASQVPEPVDAVLRLGTFLERAKSTTTYFELLAEQPRALELLVRLFGSGQYLSGMLASHPELIDLLISPETLRAGGRAARSARADGHLPTAKEEEAALQAKLHRALSNANTPERRRRVLRRMTRQSLLQIGTRFVLGLDGWPATAGALSRLARASLAAAFDVVVNQQSVADGNQQQGPANWAILGAGKLAANQLNILSDLDIVLVSAAETPDELQRHTAAAQELISLFTDTTPEGIAWAIDVKLRPMGRNAPLVTTLEDISRYFAEVLDAWEFLAYARFRPVAGDMRVASDAMDALAAAYEALPARRFGATEEPFVEAVRRMRDRLADTVRIGRATIETKRRHGGLIDLEFVLEMAIASCVAEGTMGGAAPDADDDDDERDSGEHRSPAAPPVIPAPDAMTMAMPILTGSMPLPGSGEVRARLAEWLGDVHARRLRKNLTFLYRFEAIVRMLSGRREDSVSRTDERIEAITHGLGIARSKESLTEMLERMGHENIELFEKACEAASAWFSARAE